MSRFAEFRRLQFVALWVAVLGAVVEASLSWAAGGLDASGHRERLRMADEPKGALQVLAVQRAFVAAPSQLNAPAMRDVVVCGQIGGMPNVWPEQHPTFPWYEGQASFFLVDSKIAAQFASHAKHHGGNHNCAFCQSLAAKNAHAIAVVNLVDERGEIIRLDTRELLGLKENQVVTVRGKARLLGGSMLVIDADGVYARPK
jgi:hypothetical protein